jgi:hypothetical protein
MRGHLWGNRFLEIGNLNPKWHTVEPRLALATAGTERPPRLKVHRHGPTSGSCRESCSAGWQRRERAIQRT